MEQSYVLKPNVPVEVQTPDPMVLINEYYSVQSGGNGVILYIMPVMDGNVIVHSGDSVFAGKELDFEVMENQAYFVHLETGAYMITKGEHKGCIYVESDCDANIQLIELG